MTRLAEARARRGWKKSALVHRLTYEAARNAVSVATPSSLMRMVAQWENGYRSPDQMYCTLLCAVYECTADELGLPSASSGNGSRIGLTYEPRLSDAVSALARLSRLDQRGETSVSGVGFSPDTLHAATLDWLFAPHHNDAVADGAPVRAEDIAEIRAATATFDELDRRFGGEHSRPIALTYLRDGVLPRLRGRYPDEVGRELHSAAAVLCELIGWMSYDAARHSLAQRYFVQALRLARAAGDDAYGTYVLTSMSDQALFMQKPDQALRLAQIARTRESGGPPTVLAEAAMLEARAWAALGSRAEASGALQRAEHHFDRVVTGELPPWASRFDSTVLASHAGTCWIALDRPAEARRALSVVWNAVAEQPRRRAYAAVQLATVAVLEGDFDQACVLGSIAAEATSGMTSARARQHVTTFARRLQPHGAVPAVRDFNEQLRTLSMSGASA